MVLHLTFNTIEKAADANIQIFENYARTKAQVLRTATDELVNVGDVTIGDILSLIYVVAGTKNGDVITNGQGQTEQWARISERQDMLGTYFFVKPDNSLMTNVVFDTEEESNAGWYTNDTV